MKTSKILFSIIVFSLLYQLTACVDPPAVLNDADAAIVDMPTINDMVDDFATIVDATENDASSSPWPMVLASSVNDNRGNAIAIDRIGNIYLTGHFDSEAIFGTTTLTAQPTVESLPFDIFVTKISSQGEILWAVSSGGPDIDEGLDIALDASGNPYVTGFFEKQATFGTTVLTSFGDRDIFISKYYANDGTNLWALSAGSKNEDRGTSVAIDSAGNAYFTGGYFSDTAVFGQTTLTSTSIGNIFVSKVSPSGNFVWTTTATNTTGIIAGFGITIDSNNNPIVTGTFEGQATVGTITMTSNGGLDMFVAKLTPNGGPVAWISTAGGTQLDKGLDVAVDENGNTWVTGDFAGQAFFGQNTLTSFSSDQPDMFVAKYSDTGELLWAKSFGGQGEDTAMSVAVDNIGNAHVAGYFWGEVTIGTTMLSSKGLIDIWTIKISSDGQTVSAVQAGGPAVDEGHSIALDPNKDPFVTGYFGSKAIFGTKQLVSPAMYDIFVWNPLFL